MKPLYTEQEFLQEKSRDKLPCECYQCGNSFYKLKSSIVFYLKKLHENKINSKIDNCKFCSNICSNFLKIRKQIIVCKQCNKQLSRTAAELRKIKVNNFCSRSCSCTYNNIHKTTGFNISKSEIYIKNKLCDDFPDLRIEFNNRNIIGLELDIFIPSFKLAFEINGIHHYKPIFGPKTFEKVQNNDLLKLKSCLEKHIEIKVIDISKQQKFSELTTEKYYQIIKNIIINKIGDPD